MNLKYISKNLFNQYQSLLIAPTVAAYWNGMKDELWQEREGKKVILSADGRNDSPGHSAQYCTYSFADTGGSRPYQPYQVIRSNFANRVLE